MCAYMFLCACENVFVMVYISYIEALVCGVYYYTSVYVPACVYQHECITELGTSVSDTPDSTHTPIEDTDT